MPARSGHTAPTRFPTLSVPDTTVLEESFEITGMGYDPSQHVWLAVTTPTSKGWLAAGVDANGDLKAEFTGFVAGIYVFSAEYDGTGSILARAATNMS